MEGRVDNDNKIISDSESDDTDTDNNKDRETNMHNPLANDMSSLETECQMNCMNGCKLSETNDSKTYPESECKIDYTNGVTSKKLTKTINNITDKVMTKQAILMSLMSQMHGLETTIENTKRDILCMTQMSNAKTLNLASLRHLLLDLDKKLEVSMNKLERKQAKLDKLRTTNETITNELDSMTKEKETTLTEMTRLGSLLADTQANKLRLESQLQAIKDDNKRLETTIDTFTKDNSALEKEKERLKKKKQSETKAHKPGRAARQS